MYVKRACIQKLVALLLWMACMYLRILWRISVNINHQCKSTFYFRWARPEAELTEPSPVETFLKELEYKSRLFITNGTYYLFKLTS